MSFCRADTWLTMRLPTVLQVGRAPGTAQPARALLRGQYHFLRRRRFLFVCWAPALRPPASLPPVSRPRLLCFLAPRALFESWAGTSFLDTRAARLLELAVGLAAASLSSPLPASTVASCSESSSLSVRAAGALVSMSASSLAFSISSCAPKHAASAHRRHKCRARR